MLKIIKQIILVNVVWHLLPFPSYCQYSTEGLDLDKNIGVWYDEAAGIENTGLIHGRFLRTENKSKKSHPYFQENSWEAGSLIFNQQKYDQVFMKYDIRRDILILENTSDAGVSNQPLMVHQEDIKTFTLFGFNFKYLREQECPDKNPGFYNVLYKGNNLELLVKRRKEESYDQNRNYWYYEQNKFFVSYQGNFYRVFGKSSFSKVFKDMRGSIRQHIRKNKLKISTTDEKSLIAVTRFCDELIGSQ